MRDKISGCLYIRKCLYFSLKLENRLVEYRIQSWKTFSSEFVFLYLFRGSFQSKDFLSSVLENSLISLIIVFPPHFPPLFLPGTILIVKYFNHNFVFCPSYLLSNILFLFVFVVYFLRDCFQSWKFSALWCFGCSSVLGIGEENCDDYRCALCRCSTNTPVSVHFLLPALPCLLTLSPGLSKCSVRKIGF